ncbi:hypothetical protein HLB23_15640 [Nocardia uniformis]|uniref:Uncharacterized protein n=1 Tax=Nocardia uniformis TaxID=53432 RepID=A0A849C1B7_9NOCA|nr:hypothetical protein [Nocardia uniformis]NNH71276.1 hypothetical protein [Nocardia uniformis]
MLEVWPIPKIVPLQLQFTLTGTAFAGVAKQKSVASATGATTPARNNTDAVDLITISKNVKQWHGPVSRAVIVRDLKCNLFSSGWGEIGNNGSVSMGLVARRCGMYLSVVKYSLWKVNSSKILTRISQSTVVDLEVIRGRFVEV